MRPDLSTEVDFALKITPVSVMALADELGLFLSIHQSTLASEDVFITRYRPNMSGHVSICAPTTPEYPIASESSVNEPLSNQSTSACATVSFRVSLDPELKIAHLTTHLDVLPSKDQELLRSGAVISVQQLSPFRLAIDIGSDFRHQISLPIPLELTGGKTRIARKSSYIEYIAPVAAKDSLSVRPESLFPTVLQETPTLRNLPYVKLDRLPILNIKDKSNLEWMNPHVGSMFSARERRERDTCLKSGIKCQDSRINFKDSLLSLFMHFTALQGGQRHAVFGIDHRGNGGVHILILPSNVRLDMSNQSVVLDAAVVPLSMDVIPKLMPFFSAALTSDLVSILVDDSELLLWKHALPAFVERCRDWEHTSSCEYKAKGQIPVSVKFGEPILCSCGKGKFSKDYKIDKPALWKDVCKHAVRAAISPCFSVPFVERTLALSMSKINESLQNMADRLGDLFSKKGSCFVCGKKEAQGGGKVLKCGSCKVMEYCSKECQRKDWIDGEHKISCKLLRKIS
ncbi:hypothetical protein VTN77DRAFT_9698 [Rasamsonia byssochlamydoides]|uniref:uncharacterized protein n=1 Tax=Rasamsonia byssochlamydoides TaxID=89139 RepID=UPI00374231DE